MTTGQPLAGVHCLVLRPCGQAGALRQQLQRLGAEVTHCPTTDIQPLAPAAAQLEAVAGAHWLIFVSPNAVTQGLRVLGGAGGALPQRVRLAAVGAGTARALRAAGRAPDALPAEGGGGAVLLRHPELQSMDGQRVVIVRGEGGREELAQVLAERGARVSYLEVYRRLPARGVNAAGTLARWRQGSVRVTIVTSVSGWRHLLALAPAAARRAILDGAVVAVSRRVLEAAASDGHRGPGAVAADPGPAALAEAVASLTRENTERT